MNDSGIYLARSPGDGGDYLAPLMLTVPVYFSRQTLVDLLICAAEGGSNYWAAFKVTARADGDDSPIAYDVTEYDEDGEPADPPRVFHVNAERMAAGIAKLATNPPPFPSARRHLGDVLNDNADAETADVILQLATLGDVVYG
jgi:hypothetical protein